MRNVWLSFWMALAVSLLATTSMAEDFDDGIPADETFDDADGSPAVPEPGAALAMGAGLATVAFALRRRR